MQAQVSKVTRSSPPPPPSNTSWREGEAKPLFVGKKDREENDGNLRIGPEGRYWRAGLENAKSREGKGVTDVQGSSSSISSSISIYPREEGPGFLERLPIHSFFRSPSQSKFRVLRHPSFIVFVSTKEKETFRLSPPPPTHALVIRFSFFSCVDTP